METLYIKVLREKLIVLNAFILKTTTTMNGYSECHDPRETYK